MKRRNKFLRWQKLVEDYKVQKMKVQQQKSLQKMDKHNGKKT